MDYDFKNFTMSYKSTAKLMNDRILTDYFIRLMLIARSLFKYENLPNGMDEKWIERYLFSEGACLFYKDPTYGYMVAKIGESGTLNYYDEPTLVRPYATNYIYKGEQLVNNVNCVIIRNNDEMLPTAPTLQIYAYDLTNIKRTQDTNIVNLKMPTIVRCSDKQKLSLKQTIAQRNDNEPVIWGDKNLDLSNVEVLDLKNNKIDRIRAQDCAFGYRTSIFKIPENTDRYIITAVELKIPKKWTPNLNYASLEGLEDTSARGIYNHISDVRNSKLPSPKVLGNAGSFFKNPVVEKSVYEKLVSEYDHVPGYGTDDGSTVKLAAGWLIEKAGCKGLRMGNAGTYEKQSLILVNYGGASPDELIGVACFVRNKVADKFGIVLEPEVRIIGKKGECHL